MMPKTWRQIDAKRGLPARTEAERVKALGETAMTDDSGPARGETDHVSAIIDRADRLYHAGLISAGVRADLIDHAEALAKDRDEAEQRAALLQQTCWQGMKLNAQVTTKHESDPDYYDGVERLHALVCKCEAEGLLPPPRDIAPDPPGDTEGEE